MKSDDLPPLPEKLVEEMRALKRITPPTDLVERTFQGLPERKVASRLPEEAPRKQKWPLARMALLNVAPALALAALLVYVFIGRGGPSQIAEIVRSEERQLALPEEGHAWMDLDLQTQHHADQPAVVHVEVPTHVRVRLPDGNGQALERHCTEERCVHRFMHAGGSAPLRVAVAHPGRYEIHVRHESKKASLHENFVLTAMR